MHTSVCQALNDHGSRVRLHVGHALASFDVYALDQEQNLAHHIAHHACICQVCVWTRSVEYWSKFQARRKRKKAMTTRGGSAPLTQARAAVSRPSEPSTIKTSSMRQSQAPDTGTKSESKGTVEVGKTLFNTLKLFHHVQLPLLGLSFLLLRRLFVAKDVDKPGLHAARPQQLVVGDPVPVSSRQNEPYL